MSEAVTKGVRVRVETRYLPERSNPLSRQFLFAYEVTIRNEGEEAVRLLTRHWIITDANNKVEEVEGLGVVGETPVIRPGQAFTYTSFCPLRTEFGTMHGTYGMVRPSGEEFDARISPFALKIPNIVN